MAQFVTLTRMHHRGLPDDAGLLDEGDAVVGLQDCAASSSSSESSSGSSSSDTSPKAKKRFTSRTPNCGDRSAHIPMGCKMRRYEKPGSAPFWHGILPVGVTDGNGCRNRQRRWHHRTHPDGSPMTGDDIIEEIESWLWDNYSS